jgi:hypothetical protein
MNSGVNGEPWQAARSWRGCRGFAATDGPTCSLYRSLLTRTFTPALGDGFAGPGDVGVETALSQEESAAKAVAAAPPRSRPRREIKPSIRGSENLVTHGWHSSAPFGDSYPSEWLAAAKALPWLVGRHARRAIALVAETAGGLVRRKDDTRCAGRMISAGD